MSPDCAVFEPYPQAEEIWSYLRGRFGFPREVFFDHRLWHKPGYATIWITHKTCRPPAAVQVDALGIALMRQPLPRGFPTTVFLQRFGIRATRNVHELDMEAILALIRGRGVLPSFAAEAKAGPFILKCGNFIAGRGWIRDGLLYMDAPKEWRKSLFPQEVNP